MSEQEEGVVRVTFTYTSPASVKPCQDFLMSARIATPSPKRINELVETFASHPDRVREMPLPLVQAIGTLLLNINATVLNPQLNPANLPIVCTIGPIVGTEQKASPHGNGKVPG